MSEKTPAYLAQFAPMPGDTMSDPWDGVYTVTSVVGDEVFCDYDDGGYPGNPPYPTSWSLAMWSEDDEGKFTYARPSPV